MLHALEKKACTCKCMVTPYNPVLFSVNDCITTLIHYLKQSCTDKLQERTDKRVAYYQFNDCHVSLNRLNKFKTTQSQ